VSLQCHLRFMCFRLTQSNILIHLLFSHLHFTNQAVAAQRAATACSPYFTFPLHHLILEHDARCNNVHFGPPKLPSPSFSAIPLNYPVHFGAYPKFTQYSLRYYIQYQRPVLFLVYYVILIAWYHLLLLAGRYQPKGYKRQRRRAVIIRSSDIRENI